MIQYWFDFSLLFLIDAHFYQLTQSISSLIFVCVNSVWWVIKLIITSKQVLCQHHSFSPFIIIIWSGCGKTKKKKVVPRKRISPSVSISVSVRLINLSSGWADKFAQNKYIYIYYMCLTGFTPLSFLSWKSIFQHICVYTMKLHSSLEFCTTHLAQPKRPKYNSFFYAAFCFFIFWFVIWLCTV